MDVITREKAEGLGWQFLIVPKIGDEAGHGVALKTDGQHVKVTSDTPEEALLANIAEREGYLAPEGWPSPWAEEAEGVH